MQISTMTSTFSKRRNSPDFISVIDSIHKCKDAGFSVLDLNLCAMQRNESEFNADTWYERAVALREEAEKIGVTFCQSHLPYRAGNNALYSPTADEEFFKMITYRALEISSIAGARWAIAHPAYANGISCEDTEAQLKANHLIFDEVVEKANNLGVGIAFENMADKNKRKFGSMATELVSLVDSFNKAVVGVCWDFGHAAIMYENQVEGIRRVGNRLKAVHVADNWGINDDHILPFEGLNKWEEIMKALREIGFDGNMVFEVKINNYMPDELKHHATVYCAEIGKYLISL